MTRRIRVLQLGSPTGMYGAERWILALIKHLDPHRIQTVVGVIRDDPGKSAPLLASAAELGFETCEISAPGRFNVGAVRSLRKVLLERQIDILHTHFYKADVIGLLAARGTDVRTLATPHGWSQSAGIALRLYELIDRICFLGFDAVAPLSSDLAATVPRSVKRVVTIRNGVDIDEVRSVSHLAPETVRWRSDDEFVIGYVGQLIPRKGLATLFRAAAACGISKARLVIVGEGESRNELEALAKELGISERTEFLGYRSDRIALMKGFSVFVLPSVLEGIPRCIMEAMAAETAVVMSDIPGCRELVGPGPTALVFPPGDYRALGARLRDCHESATRAQLVRSAARFVNEKFSAAAMAGSYQALFESMCGSDAPASAVRGT